MEYRMKFKKNENKKNKQQTKLIESIDEKKIFYKFRTKAKQHAKIKNKNKEIV